MTIKEVRLKTRNMFKDMNPDDADYQLWQNITEYMDGKTAVVAESSAGDG